MTLPTGTVTFLFTDIEGSAALAQQHPAEMPALLARHHAVLHESIAAHNGHVFQIVGDAFCVAFATAGDALAAALDAQRALQQEPWQPRRPGLERGSDLRGTPPGETSDRDRQMGGQPTPSWCGWGCTPARPRRAWETNGRAVTPATCVTANCKMLKTANVKMLTLVKWCHFRQNGLVSQTATEGATHAESGASIHDQDPV